MGESAYSEEERLARSERAKALHAQGRLGGAEFGKLGGRPPKKRSSELLAEKAADNAEKIWTKLEQLMESESEKVVLDTIKHIQTIEENERKTQVEEEVKYDQLKHAELAELVIGNLFDLLGEGAIDGRSLGFEDQGDEERRVIGTGEEDDSA